MHFASHSASVASAEASFEEPKLAEVFSTEATKQGGVHAFVWSSFCAE